MQDKLFSQFQALNTVLIVKCNVSNHQLKEFVFLKKYILNINDFIWK